MESQGIVIKLRKRCRAEKIIRSVLKNLTLLAVPTVTANSDGTFLVERKYKPTAIHPTAYETDQWSRVPLLLKLKLGLFNARIVDRYTILSMM